MTSDDPNLESELRALLTQARKLEAIKRYRDRYRIELLANLDKVPEAGAIVVVPFRKPRSRSGFPARVFAVVP